MSDPKTTTDDPIRSAMSEILSAQSALNMYPDPIPPNSDEPRHLADSDRWAQHAQEHLVAAFDLIRQAYDERAALHTEIQRLKLARYRGSEHPRFAHPEPRYWPVRDWLLPRRKPTP